MEIESCKRILVALRDASEEAGIADKMILGFGTLLGAVRNRSIIEHDTDMDVCFLPLTIEEKEKYYDICHRKGLFNGWFALLKQEGDGKIYDKIKEFECTDRISREISRQSSEINWFSTKIGESETKCCNWFLTEWEGIMWHHKGPFWKKDFGNTRGGSRCYLKGAKSEFFRGTSTIEFLGESFRIPNSTGSLLDFWYPNWMVPKYEGESCHDIIATYDNYFDKTTWRLE